MGYQLPAAVGYAGSGIALSATSFIALILKDAGLASDTIGYVMATFEASLTLGMPLVLLLVDRYGGLRWALTALVLLSTGGLFGAVLLVHGASSMPTGVAVCTVVALFCLAPCGRLWDRAVLAMLQRDGAIAHWGRYRTLQSVLYGLMAPVCGALQPVVGWIVVPIQFAVGYGAVLCVVHCGKRIGDNPHCGTRNEDDAAPATAGKDTHPISPPLAQGDVEGPPTAEDPPPLPPPTPGDAMVCIYTDPRLWLFLVSNGLLGIPCALIGSFHGLWMRQLGGSTALIGFAASTQTALEALVFAGSAWILQRHALERLYVAGLVCMGLRLAGLAAITHAWMALPLDLLHGGSYALTWLACVQLFTERVPQRVAATGFAILSLTSWGVGQLAGTLAGGVVFRTFGARVMYALGAAWTLLLLLGFVVVARRQGRLGAKED